MSTLPAEADPQVVFLSARGLLRDPSNTSGDLRKALDRAGFPLATSHTFRKTVATRLDDARTLGREFVMCRLKNLLEPHRRTSR